MSTTPEQRILNAIQDLIAADETPSVRKVRQMAGTSQAVTANMLQEWRAGNLDEMIKPITAPRLNNEDLQALAKPFEALLNALFRQWNENISDKLAEAKATTKQAVEESTEAINEAEELKAKLEELRQERERLLAEVARAQAGEEKALAQVNKADKQVEKMRDEVKAMQEQLTSAREERATAIATLEAFKTAQDPTKKR